MDNVDAPELALGDHIFEVDAGGLEIFSVRGHEHDLVAGASFDHFLGLLNRCRQRLFREHVLFRVGSRDRVGFMLSRRSGNIYRLNLLTGETILKFLIGKNMGRLEALRKLGAFPLVPRYERH